MASKKSVVILGGGYLGTRTAVELEKQFDVTIVEKNDKFHHVIGSPRAFVQAGFETSIFFPYDRLLKHGKVIHDEAVDIVDKTVVLKSGTVLNFDYLVIATGSKYFSPIRSGLKFQETVDVFRKFQEALKTAKTAVVVGGGNVGVEISSEIKYHFPQVEVTLINSGPKVMHASPVNDAFRDALEAKLKKLGVVILANTKVIIPEEERHAIATTPQQRTLKTADDKEIVSDVQILATGFTGFNTETLRATLSDHIDAATNKVKVNSFLQLESKPYIFAGGDVALTGEFEQSGNTSGHSEVISANIRTLAAGQTKLKVYKPSHPKIVVVVGLKTGQAYGIPFKTTVLGNTIANFKTGDYFTARIRAPFNVDTSTTDLKPEATAGSSAAGQEGESKPAPALARRKSWFGLGSMTKLAETKLATANAATTNTAETKAEETNADETKTNDDETKTAETKTDDEAKTVETKTAETKTAETKTAETSATETKVVEANATETKTDETKVVEANAAETHATETHATETHATETKTEETKVVETHAAETHAAETHATEAHTAEAKAAETTETKTVEQPEQQQQPEAQLAEE